MSTPEIIVLIKVLPKVLVEHPEWLTEEELTTLKRLVRELTGVPVI